MVEAEELECAVVGGGPAGLTAAIYLGRYRRRFALFETGDSRALLIPRSLNYPGFPDGVTGPELMQRLRTQAERYHAPLIRDEVSLIERQGKGFLLQLGDRAVRARFVLLATGIIDNQPELSNLREIIRRGHLRLCPVCDGYEVGAKSVAVLGATNEAVKKALFLSAVAPNVIVLSINGQEPDPQQCEQLARRGIECVPDRVIDLKFDGEQIEVLRSSGVRTEVEVLYPALGAQVRSHLASRLGACCDESGYLSVDAHQRTSVPGLYAAGDVVNELSQIAVACGHAAIAATDIYNQLRS